MRKTIKKIIDLKWEELNESDLEKLMILSAYSALEFADSLRLTLKLNPENEQLKEMAEEELKTDNLKFDDYDKIGDHAQFLWHFVEKYKLLEKHPELEEAGEKYIENIKKLSDTVRIMSIASREIELPEIFDRILTAKKWDLPPLQAYKYYLERHITLDSCEGGHADMLKMFEVTSEVDDFYKIRLDLYRSIASLF